MSRRQAVRWARRLRWPVAMKTLRLPFSALLPLLVLPACGATPTSGEPSASGGASASTGGAVATTTGGASAGVTSSGGATSSAAVSEGYPFASSGQRLEAWFFTMDGGGAGTSLFSTFHDALLDLDCGFVPAATPSAEICAPNVGVEVVF